MSTEQPVQRWFTGLEGLEALALGARLRVTESDFSQTDLEANDTMRLPVDEVGRIGLRLLLSPDLDAIGEAVKMTNLNPEDVKVLVIAEDRFLKERTILIDPELASFLSGETIITKVDEPRKSALANPFNGFELSLIYVLGQDCEATIARRPHRKGTILASASWTIRGQRDAAGLDPLPLKEDVLDKAKLPKGTLLYVESDGELLLEDDLRSVKVYVHEGLLKRVAQGRGADRTTVLQQLSIDALVQLVYLVARQIEPDYVWDGQGSAALRLIQTLLKDLGRPASTDSIAALVRDETQRVVAIVSGAGKQAARLMNMFDEIDQTEGPQ